MLRSFHVLTPNGKNIYQRPLQKEIRREITALPHFGKILEQLAHDKIMDHDNLNLNEFRLENVLLAFSSEQYYHLALLMDIETEITSKQLHYFFEEINSHLEKYNTIIDSGSEIDYRENLLKTILDPIIDTIAVKVYFT